VEAGGVARARRLLARPFALEGQVVPGRGAGSRQTVPTLNLAIDTDVVPATGVYVTCTHDLDSPRRWKSVTNIGHRPTFGGGALSIETFLLDRLEAPSPKQIRVEFFWRLRDERQFASPEALKSQILRDAARSQTFFRRLSVEW
jgi:riboflavin kinase/FMN adenylyltransferase